MKSTTDDSNIRQELVSKGWKLEIFTILWNSLEGLVAITSGIVAGSIALVGFGFDSGIEVLSGLVLIVRLSLDTHEERREMIESWSLRLVGISFLFLAAYIGYDSLSLLLKHQAPERSFVGIGLAVVSLFVMPWLARQKRKIAASISSAALAADARQTDFCVYLSGILLIGLVINALFGLWWADPLAALLMLPLIAKEGIDALRGKSCCDTCH
ncbi:MAG TPA: cation transporter [Oculatellaceae cyanobacterium]|jgi:divalent metal cation (Fe/Co/Zn/Cd) transporter|nr:cation transporter [Cyanobacteria bacterium SZAS LIN-5]